MKKITGSIVALLSAMLLVNCNDSATAEKTTDSASRQTDTTNTQIVTEGGLKDSIQTGASDSTAMKDTSNKGLQK